MVEIVERLSLYQIKYLSDFIKNQNVYCSIIRLTIMYVHCTYIIDPRMTRSAQFPSSNAKR